jgi:hypothetical protein
MKGINAYRTQRYNTNLRLRSYTLDISGRLNTHSSPHWYLVNRPMTSDYALYVKGTEIHMNEFVSKIIHDVLMAILSNMRDIDLESISKIEIE